MPFWERKMKIDIIGSVASGKTTLAKNIWDGQVWKN